MNITFFLFLTQLASTACFLTPSTSTTGSTGRQKLVPTASSFSTKLLAARRTQFAGVSVSPTGFHVLLQVGQDEYLPVQVTDDPLDQSAATSPEALTILQLLAQVDLAGAIMPPDALARLVVLSAEEDCEKSVDPVETGREILASVQAQFTNGTTYTEQHPWRQSRTTLPLCTIDEVILQHVEDSSNNSKSDMSLYQFDWKVKVRDFGSISFQPTPSALEQVSYNYRPNVSLAFTSIALALRYKAPVIWNLPISKQNADDPSTMTDLHTMNLQTLQETFPMFRSMEKLSSSSDRAAVAVERGFEIHKLQAALQIALKKGDTAAAAKIRAVLDEKDSLDGLPVQPDSDTSIME